MVNQKNSTHRFAFTIIELIFAIVVMSIAVMSLPVMTRITSEGIENSLVQEAIFAASAELMSVTSYYWDGNSLRDMNTSHLSRVINIAGDCDANNLRPGHIEQPYHRRCLDYNYALALDGGADSLDSREQTDIDIFIDTSTAGTATAERTGYKNIYTSSIDVTRTINVKVITAEIKNSDGDIITRLRTQSTNIGEIDYYKRRL